MRSETTAKRTITPSPIASPPTRPDPLSARKIFKAECVIAVAGETTLDWATSDCVVTSPFCCAVPRIWVRFCKLAISAWFDAIVVVEMLGELSAF
jgi:hypothetical protein